MESKQKSLLFKFEGKPTLKEIVPLGLQHVVAMIIGCVTPAIIVAGVSGLNPQDKILLVQSSLFFAGIATLIQLFPIFRGIGSRLPIIMGVSFAYVPTLTAIAGEFSISTIFGAQIVGGIVAIIFGIFVKKLVKLFPLIVTGTVIFSIGLSLYSVAINYVAGGVGNPTFGSPKNWLVAFVTLGVVIYLNYFTNGKLKLASILVGIIVGYVVALFLGMVSFTDVQAAGWIQTPKFMHFGMSFNATAIISMVIMHIVNSVQAIGDMSATTGGAMNRVPTDKELSGGVIGNGISSIMGSFFGCMPTATFSQNVGIVTMNKVISRSVFTFASVVIIISGLVPKFASILTSIPQCVLGGATISVFAAITMTGVKMISSTKLTARNTAIVGLSIALGVGIVQVPDALALFPGWFISIFGKSSIVVTTIVAITLNLILPKDEVNSIVVNEEENMEKKL
ncbi:purine permease [Clostridium gasigenes]|uniref:uracil-xanthine permease family protein n=1 Tax=Clostridium gasigenes TaxID=94869 RepID=UPI00162A0671|nr:nucleobase:cation symporter-2 family protein [Clostridium gasigenes]MBB6623610.1 purine permease [Clostridium gasigenes]MBU3087589.1 purine permease [Clostridium gasigenes]MBU3131792.1 purine permease [Clostridium gasigenes]MBU3135264.1 purine permease [Clostridium gasigenes]